MTADDGKQRLTDVATADTLLRQINSQSGSVNFSEAMAFVPD
jgi:hypothetical protein